jgi:CRISPR system Cascade subunit CasA
VAYNLIEERWIPVRRQSGKVERIAPWQIAEKDDTPIRVESPRPDFDAALLEMLIGLVQTVMTPKDEIEWEEVYEAGIDPKKLRKRMEEVKDAFVLDGDGPRFFQDLVVHKDKSAKREGVALLLIDQGMADDSDLFAKSGRFEALGLPEAAAAILTLQSFASPGGRGQCTSLRGGGPLSVTLQDATLWRTVWCNVLNSDDLRSVPGNWAKKEMSDTFPWMGKTRTSEKPKPSTFPEDVHPLQHFWGLPRRYRLCLDDAESGTCAISGERGVRVVREFLTRPDGTSYDGPFLHPLTAYTKGKETESPNPKKGGSGLSYRDWPLLHVGGERFIPPKAVEAFYRNQRWKVAKVSRVAARGYAMDNMKPLRFVEAETPVIRIEPRLLQAIREEAVKLVEASESARLTLMQQVKSAWSDRPKDQAGDVQARTDAAFWSATEADFYRALREVAEALAKDAAGDADRVSVKTEYVMHLQAGALKVFDDLCPTDADLGGDGLARLVRARKDLRWFTRPEELAKKVGLAEPEEKPSKTKKQGKSSPKAGRKEGQP